MRTLHIRPGRVRALSRAAALVISAALVAPAQAIVFAPPAFAAVSSDSNVTVIEPSNKTATTLELTASPAPSEIGAQTTYTANLTPLSLDISAVQEGTITFEEDGVAIAGCETLKPAFVQILGPVVTSIFQTCTVTYAATGSHMVTATYSGTDTIEGSSDTITLEVAGASTETFVEDLSGGVSYPGEEVGFGVRISPTPSSVNPGSVSFSDDGEPIAGCQGLEIWFASSDETGEKTAHALCGVIFDTDDQGIVHSITATFSGDDSFASSTSDAAHHDVQAPPQDPTQTTLTQSSETSYLGAEVTFTASVTPTTATGTVAFMHDGSPFGACEQVPLTLVTEIGSDTASNIAVCTVSLYFMGSQEITAGYAGDSAFEGSLSDAVTHSVVLVPTQTTISQSSDSSLAGDQVDFTAVVTPVAAGPAEDGTVEFTDDGATIAGCGNAAVTPVVEIGSDITRYVATCSITYEEADAGDHAVAAAYSGTGMFAASDASASPVSHHVDTAVITIPTEVNLGTSRTTVLVNGSVTWTARVTPNPGAGTVAFYLDDVPVAGCTARSLNSRGVATCTTTAATLGAHAVTASFTPAAGSTFGASTSSAIPQNVTYGVAVLTQNRTVTAGRSITFEVQLVDARGRNLSSAASPLTVTGVSPAWTPRPGGSFRFIATKGRTPAHYEYTLNVPSAAARCAPTHYHLVFTALGDPFGHTEVAFTVNPAGKGR